MIKIVGVRFKNAGKIYYFDPVELEVEKSIDVVVETARGLEYGTVVVGPKEIDESELVSPLKPIIRIATDEDRQVYLENKEKAKETFELCQQKIKEHDLNMFLRYLKVHFKLTNETDFKKIIIKDITIDTIKKVTSEDILSFLSYLALNQNAKPATRARKISTLRIFFSFLSQKAKLIESFTK